jgi:hypothetical protein
MEKLPCATDKQINLTDVLNLFDVGLSNLVPHVLIDGKIIKPTHIDQLVSNPHFYSKEDIIRELAKFL